ncbi:hypothetical protein F4780DRAFT_190328 [Xylariomycetidae sp. FL0641]|nr:hypothetical protein F4780DRAFT_190328 [Xylariomycetidae sp. FL0641]
MSKHLGTSTWARLWSGFCSKLALSPKSRSHSRPGISLSIPDVFQWKKRRFLRNFGRNAQRPLHRIPNDFHESPASWKPAIFLWITSIMHLSLRIFGWAFFFPTITEWHLRVGG